MRARGGMSSFAVVLTVALAVPALGAGGASPSAARLLADARRLAKGSRWGEAVSSLELAARSSPEDAVVLSELGWAAFQAGDRRKARAALDRALRAARDPRVKASSLYSMGRVEEASGRRDLAADHYRASLALRLNATVRERLEGLVDEQPEPLPIEQPRAHPLCQAPRALEKVCACVLAELRLEDGGPASSCAVLDEPRLDGFRVLSTGTDEETALVLLEEQQGGWAARGTIDTRLTGNIYRLERVEAERTRRGPRDLLRYRVHTAGHHESLGSRSGWSEEMVTEVLCPVSAGEGETHCALQVPVLSEREDYTFGDHPTSKRDRSVLRVELEDDGVADVILVKGTAYDRKALGPHRLW